MKLRCNGKILPVIAVLALFAGCGKATFKKQDFNAVNVAGQYTQPKIDILVVQDNSSSMATPISSLKSQLDSFLSGMDSRWDIHFTVVPLQSVMSLNGKYIVAQNCSEITGGSCLTPSQISYFNNASSDYGWIRTINNAIGNTDLGFANLQSNLSHSSMTSTGFLRPDAALAVVVVSNGEDVSGISYYDPDGDGTSEIDYGSSTSLGSFQSYKSFLVNLKGGPDLLKFYSVVAANNYSSCYGGSAWRGYRYMSMAMKAEDMPASNPHKSIGGVGGAYYDLCAGGLSSVLGSIAGQLNSMIEAYIFNYAVIDSEPVPSSIVVKKNGVTIPQSATNGWQYVGYMANQYTSYYPQLSNRKTGYFIKLNGTAEYHGNDIITVDFQKK